MKAMFDKRVGSIDTEEEFLKSRSPLFQSEQISVPLLIGQGANDPRVKKAESDQIVHAMRANGKPVEYIVFADEGHGFARPKTACAFLGRDRRLPGEVHGRPRRAAIRGGRLAAFYGMTDGRQRGHFRQNAVKPEVADGPAEICAAGFSCAVGAAAAARLEGTDTGKSNWHWRSFLGRTAPKLSPNGIPIILALILSPRTERPGMATGSRTVCVSTVPGEDNLLWRQHKRWMVNFRIRNMDKMAALLRAAGITVDIDRKFIQTDGLLVCTIPKAIRLSSGNRKDATPNSELSYRPFQRPKCNPSIPVAKRLIPGDGGCRSSRPNTRTTPPADSDLDTLSLLWLEPTLHFGILEAAIVVHDELDLLFPGRFFSGDLRIE